MKLHLARGEQHVYRNLWYKGKVRLQVIGEWLPRQVELVWVMSDLDSEQALDFYRQRRKIEERYRDRKTLLGMGG
nr:hypothetical protein [Ardenticatena sp.]